MSWRITPTFYGFIADADAKDYLARVHAAEGQTLEPAVALAIETFIVGCKADGIWNAIKASCILAGARTLTGALVPLVGAAPTNFNFVAGDYNRKTGLVGNASTKYLDSNRNNSADPQNSKHFVVWVASAGTPSSATQSFGGQFISAQGNTNMGMFSGQLFARNNTVNSALSLGSSTITGLIGTSRGASTSYVHRAAGASTTIAEASISPVATTTLHIFGDNAFSPVRTNARLAFYSIGESLDLALLDARVTGLINAFAAAIP